MHISLIRKFVPRLRLNLHFLALRQHFRMCFVCQIPPLPIPYSFPYKRKPLVHVAPTPLSMRENPRFRGQIYALPLGGYPKENELAKADVPPNRQFCRFQRRWPAIGG